MRWSSAQSGHELCVGGLPTWPVDKCSNKDAGKRERMTPTRCERTGKQKENIYLVYSCASHVQQVLLHLCVLYSYFALLLRCYLLSRCVVCQRSRKRSCLSTVGHRLSVSREWSTMRHVTGTPKSSVPPARRAGPVAPWNTTTAGLRILHRMSGVSTRGGGRGAACGE